MSHYFINDENQVSNEKEFQVEVLKQKYKFITDNGVFSKGEYDTASKLLVETVSTLEIAGDVLDVGCGYGALGVVLATKNPEAQVHMIDVNLRALDLAKRNAQLNNVENVQVYESDLYQAVEKKDFDLVISNPPIRAGKKVVHDVLTGANDVLKQDGALVIVIGKQHGAASAQKKMMEVFGNVERIARDKGFWILSSVKG